MTDGRCDVKQDAGLVVEQDARFDLHRVALDPVIEVCGDPAQALLARWQAYAYFALDHPGRYRLMFGPELPPAAAFQAPESPGRQAFHAAVAGIAWCQEAGAATVKDDPFRLAALAWAAVHGLVSLRLDGPNFPWPPLDGMITQTLRCLLDCRQPHRVPRNLMRLSDQMSDDPPTSSGRWRTRTDGKGSPST